MPGKRSRRGKVQIFQCPQCESRLWRMGSEKHHLFYSESAELAMNTGLSRRNAAILITQGEYVDRRSWIEEFFCGDHGKMWLLIRHGNDGQATAVPATEQDWRFTTGTRNPDRPNPSVSEFTYRMSRGAS